MRCDITSDVSSPLGRGREGVGRTTIDICIDSNQFYSSVFKVKLGLSYWEEFTSTVVGQKDNHAGVPQGVGGFWDKF